MRDTLGKTLSFCLDKWASRRPQILVVWKLKPLQHRNISARLFPISVYFFPVTLNLTITKELKTVHVFIIIVYNSEFNIRQLLLVTAELEPYLQHEDVCIS